MAQRFVTAQRCVPERFALQARFGAWLGFWPPAAGSRNPNEKEASFVF